MRPDFPGAPSLKPLVWAGRSKDDLRVLPPGVVDVFGYALYLAQCGRRHQNSRILKGFGDAGVLEVVANDRGNTYRMVYTVRYPKAIFVLHVFPKKSKSGRSTPRSDRDLIASRLKVAARLAEEMKT